MIMAKRTMALGAAGLAMMLGAGTYSAVNAHNAEEAMSEVAITAALNALPVPQAGLYSVKSQLLEFFIPGSPDEEMAQAGDTVAAFFPEGQNVCLNEIEAANLLSASIPVVDQENCRITHFTVKGQAYDARGTCRSLDGSPEYISATGSMSTDGFDATLSMQDAPETGSSIMKVKLDVERIGDCTPG